jgi:hypothetical protein
MVAGGTPAHLHGRLQHRLQPGAAAPVEQPAQRDLAELGGGEGLERTAVTADRGPDRLADHDFTH